MYILHNIVFIVVYLQIIFKHSKKEIFTKVILAFILLYINLYNDFEGLFFLNNIFIAFYDFCFYIIPDSLILLDLIFCPNILDLKFKVLAFFITFIALSQMKKVHGGDIKLISFSIFSIKIEHIGLYFLSICFFSLILFMIENRNQAPMAPAIIISKFLFLQNHMAF